MAHDPSPERTEVCDALTAVAPDAPTLCEGWTARDLAVHLVLRDGRPDVLLGEAAASKESTFGRAAARVRARYEAMAWDDLVDVVRTGPPPWVPTRLPAVERAVNGAEFYVHAQDVVRAQPGWAPGDGAPLRPGQRERLWRALRLLPLRYPRAGVGVVRQVPSGPTATVHRGARSVTLVGQPEELLLHAYGRRAQAAVQVRGADDAVAAFLAAYPSTARG